MLITIRHPLFSTRCWNQEPAWTLSYWHCRSSSFGFGNGIQ